MYPIYAIVMILIWDLFFFGSKKIKNRLINDKFACESILYRGPVHVLESLCKLYDR